MTIATTQAPGYFAVLLAQFTGVMANWATVLPSYESAKAAYDALPPEVKAQLADRAVSHGMNPVDLMQKVPETLWSDPTNLSRWMDMMDVSHIKSVHNHPELANDPTNVTWEVSSTNRARGATNMSGAEYRDATDTASDTARDFTGDATWWDLNDVFRGFLDCASFIGYSGATIPKPVWLEMLNTIKSDLPLIDNEKTFAGKFKRARAFALKVKHFFSKHKHHMAAAFLLGMLCIFWPPAQFFMAFWAMAGLFGIAVHVLRKLSQSGSRRFRFLRMLERIDTSLAKLQWVLNQARDLLTKIKDGIFYATAAASDIIFSSLNKVWTDVVKPAVASVIKKGKDLLSGFLNWMFGTPAPAFA
jgi:hypothetical protein